MLDVGANPCVNRPEDSEYEVKCIRPELANFDVFPSIWGRKYISRHCKNIKRAN